MMRCPRSIATAVRTPGGKIIVRRKPYRSFLAKLKINKIPLLRGGLHLIESMAIGIGALMFSAEQAMEDEEVDRAEDLLEGPRRPRGHIALRLRAEPGPLLLAAADGHGVDGCRERGRVQPDRRRVPAGGLPGLHPDHLAPGRHEAALPVPRRRTQDDPCLRGEPAARARECTAVHHAAPALRHELPDVRDVDLGPRVHPAGQTRDDRRAAHPPGLRPGDRRDQLRIHQAVGEAVVRAMDEALRLAGPDAAEDHHPRARRRPGRGRDGGAHVGARGRGRGHRRRDPGRDLRPNRPAPERDWPSCATSSKTDSPASPSSKAHVAILRSSPTRSATAK